MDQSHFNTILYLKKGNKKQKRAYNILLRHQIMEQLSAFTPILVGTIPIEIDIDSSDLDIICQYKAQIPFKEFLIETFGHYPEFKVNINEHQTMSSVVASFLCESFIIEVFGQPIPCKEQNAYRHMIIEHRLIQERGETFRQQIVQLKQQGLKTEPAFSKLLGLTGNPYQALLEVK